MLTPIFELSQDQKFVKAIINAPFAKVSETEIEIIGNEVLFSSNPYFLHLYLPDEVIENGEESAEYDADTGKITVIIPKKDPGKHFPGLDMITKLLTPPGRANATCPVEEIQIDGDEDDDGLRVDEQVLPSSSSSSVVPNNTDTHGYGFANRRCGVLCTLRDELSEIFDIKSIDDISIVDRRQIAFGLELSKFSEDHYLCDYFDEEIKWIVDQACCVSFLPISSSSHGPFTSEEIDRLKNLPRKAIHLSGKECEISMSSLIDILYSYAYDMRTTSGEHTVESGWTVSKLSSALSCLVSWNDPKEAIVASVRRSLCYPLYRNWALAVRVLDDVRLILQGGKRVILRCLLDIHRMFANDSDYRYVLNDLYITDYCVWIQNVEDAVFSFYHDEIKKVSNSIKKADVSLNLEELELTASMAGFGMNSQEDADEDDVRNHLDSDDEDNSISTEKGSNLFAAQ